MRFDRLVAFQTGQPTCKICVGIFWHEACLLHHDCGSISQLQVYWPVTLFGSYFSLVKNFGIILHSTVLMLKTGLNFKRIHCTSSKVLDISFVSRPFLRIGDSLLTAICICLAMWFCNLTPLCIAWQYIHHLPKNVRRLSSVVMGG